tara:strand:+ start:395 stop:625 length:231 start_codon:yes stop_codon:yes gene_type:complete
MNEINFKEGWKTATLKCVMCRRSEEVEYDPDRSKRHIQGENVQDVWVEASKQYREKMIALRTGIYICDDCFPKDKK